jgi:hypothetical protein
MRSEIYFTSRSAVISFSGGEFKSRERYVGVRLKYV